MYNRCFQFAKDKEACYWLGYMYCDGFVRGSRLIMTLSIKSEPVLDALIKYAGFDLCIKKHRTVANKYRGEIRYYETVSATFNGPEFFNDISQYGVYGKKRDRTIYPRFLSSEHQLAFLSGCYEADGHSRSSHISMGNINVLRHIKEIHNIPYPIRSTTGKLGNVPNLSLGADLKRNLIENFMPPVTSKWSMKYRGTPKEPSPRTVRINSLASCITDIISDSKTLVIQELATKYQVGYKAMTNFLKRNNVKVRTGQEVAQTKRKFNPSISELKAHLEAKTPMVQLGRLYGVSDNAVKKRARFFGLI